MFGFIGFLVFAAGFVMLFVYFRAKAMAPRMAALAKHGIDGRARVTRKFSTGMGAGRRHMLTYTLHLGAGQDFSRTIAPSTEQWASLQEGDALPIVYLPDNPKVNATKEIIELMRSAAHD